MKEMEIKRVIIAGVFAEGCIRASALRAKSESLEVIVIEDAITSNKAFRKKWALKKLLKANVEIMTTEEYIEEST